MMVRGVEFTTIKRLREFRSFLYEIRRINGDLASDEYSARLLSMIADVEYALDRMRDEEE